MDRGLLDQLAYRLTERTLKAVAQMTDLSEPTLRRILQGQPVTQRTRAKITYACLTLLSGTKENDTLDGGERRNREKGMIHETEDAP